MNTKTKFLIAAVMFTAAGSAVNAQGVSGSQESGYEIKAGEVTMTVSATEGGKIMSYKYAGREMLAQSRVPNQYGSTFWTSPQVEWNWPPVNEFDRMEYTLISSTPNQLILQSRVAQKLPFQITKRYTPDPKGRFIRITYTITNMGSETRQVAPWEISRVVSDESGLIFFDAPAEQITPAGLIPFKSELGASWYTFESAQQNRKINSDGKGWLAYVVNGLLMIKKFDDIGPSEWAPNEAEIQIYINQGKTYIELESQGAYKTVAPGGSLDWSVDWYMIPYNDDVAPSKKLLKTVNKTIKSSKKMK